MVHEYLSSSNSNNNNNNNYQSQSQQQPQQLNSNPFQIDPFQNTNTFFINPKEQFNNIGIVNSNNQFYNPFTQIQPQALSFPYQQVNNSINNFQQYLQPQAQPQIQVQPQQFEQMNFSQQDQQKTPNKKKRSHDEPTTSGILNQEQHQQQLGHYFQQLQQFRLQNQQQQQQQFTSFQQLNQPTQPSSPYLNQSQQQQQQQVSPFNSPFSTPTIQPIDNNSFINHINNGSGNKNKRIHTNDNSFKTINNNNNNNDIYNNSNNNSNEENSKFSEEIKKSLIEKNWKNHLEKEFEKDYFKSLMSFLDSERETGIVLSPPTSQIFRCFNETPFDKVKIVILGQEPEKGSNQANGLAFSVDTHVTKQLPSTLLNIYSELQSDLNCCKQTQHGNLEKWAKQGVLLLNSSLTIKKGSTESHGPRGWEQFTDYAIECLIKYRKGIIFFLWGKNAQQKVNLINQSNNNHTILTASSPSQFSAQNGFFSCHHFSIANKILIQSSQLPIDWDLDNDNIINNNNNNNNDNVENENSNNNKNNYNNSNNNNNSNNSNNNNINKSSENVNNGKGCSDNSINSNNNDSDNNNNNINNNINNNSNNNSNNNNNNNNNESSLTKSSSSTSLSSSTSSSKNNNSDNNEIENNKKDKKNDDNENNNDKEKENNNKENN